MYTATRPAARRDRREDHAGDVVTEVPGRRAEHGLEPSRFVPPCRNLADEWHVGLPLRTDEVRERERQHERGEREQRERAGVQRGVRLGMGPGAGKDAERDCDGECQDLRVEHECDRHRQRRLQLVPHLQAVLVVLPEVAVDEVPEPRPVLWEEGPIEAVLLTECVPLLLGAEGDRGHRRVAREESQQAEREERREHDDHDEPEQPSRQRGRRAAHAANAAVRPGLTPRARARGRGAARRGMPACRRRRAVVAPRGPGRSVVRR